jgi:hypothetical protein
LVYFSSSHFCLRKLLHLFNIHVPFSLSDYDIRFVVRDGSVGLHLLIP